MGYNEHGGGCGVTVIAKISAVGSKYLLTDPGRFNITKFGLADDEVNYGLWNTNHADGTTKYGERIESLPTLEPISNSYLQCKYWLLTGVDRGIIRLPYFQFSPSEITLKYGDSKIPMTIEILQGNHTDCEIEIKDGEFFTLSSTSGMREIDKDPLVHTDWTVDAQFLGNLTQTYRSHTSATYTWRASRNTTGVHQRSIVTFTLLDSNIKAEISVTVHDNSTITLQG